MKLHEFTLPNDVQDISYWNDLFIKGGMIFLKILIIYFIYLIVRSLSRRIIKTSFSRIRTREKVSPGRSKTLESLSGNVISYILVFVLLVTIFQVLGIPATSILAGAGVVGLAVGFGAQGLVSDVVTGFFLLLERQLDVGDYVTIGTFSGVVEQLGLKTTIIRGMDGTLHYLPNRQITSLSNHSRGNMSALVDISFPADKEVEPLIKLLQEACSRVAEAQSQNIIEGPSVLGVQSFDSSNVVIRILAKTINGEQADVERSLRKTIKEQLEEQKRLESSAEA
jgi:moderate conductance mechanosensitive channel